MAQDYRTLKLEVLAETKQFVKGMSDANKETATFGDKLGDFAKKAGVALAAVGAAAGVMAVKIGKEAIAAASDLAESTSKVGVIFGNVSKEIEDFASTAAASLGQTRIQAQNAASTFATFGKAAGLSGQDLSNFSIEFVKLASDLASFNNTSVDQAINALGAALRGEAEPIRAYGVLLNDATLKAKAMEMGIYSGTGTLTAQQKVLAAHQVVLGQTTDAQGDFARTADGMANSQKILTARLEEAKITLGQALLPIALQVVNLFNDKFLPVIEKISGAFSNQNGSGVIDKVRVFVTEARDFLNPIIESVQNAFGKVSEAISVNSGNFQSVIDLVKTLYSFFQTYFVPLLKTQVVNAISGIGTAFSLMIKVVSPIIGTIADLIAGIVTIVDKAINSIKGLINTAIDAINAVIRAYNAIPFLGNVPTIPKIGGSSASTGSNTVSSNSLPSGFSTTKTPTITSGATTPTVTSPTGLLNTASAAKVAAGVTGAAISSGFSPAAFRAGEERSMAGITINLQAPSIIDEDGFARAMVSALNSVQDRTGGGGGGLRGIQLVQ